MASPAYNRVSGVVFALIALGHGWRAIRALPAEVGTTVVPVSVSWVAVVVAGALAVWAFRARS